MRSGGIGIGGGIGAASRLVRPRYRWKVVLPGNRVVRTGAWHDTMKACRKAALRAGVAKLDRETGQIWADVLTEFEVGQDD